MKITLQVNGRAMTFSEKELTSILEEHFESHNFKPKTSEIAKIPTEGKWFRVNPLTIDQTLFLMKRTDWWQERVRELILEAFEEVRKNPKYANPFFTMVPQKDWPEATTVGRLKNLVSQYGYHIADWVEQALEWAQRIHNGEKWEELCNKRDASTWFRLIEWKQKGTYRLVGQSKESQSGYNPTAYINYDRIYEDYNSIGKVAPLVSLYE